MCATARSGSKSKSKAGQSAGPTFEVILEELDTLVTRLETGELTLEESVGLFEKGMKLIAEGNTRLDAAERRVEQLLIKDGVERRVPFDDSSVDDTQS